MQGKHVLFAKANKMLNCFQFKVKTRSKMLCQVELFVTKAEPEIMLI